MKKIISILLILTIISSCLVLVGCGFIDVINKKTSATDNSTTTQKPTTTTSTTNTAEPPYVDPSTLEFEHGDNFTDEDIEFVRNLQGCNPWKINEIIQYDFEDFLIGISKGLYYTSIKIDAESPWFICAFIDLDQRDNQVEHTRNILNIEKYVWYKFNDLNTIPDLIGEMERCFSYALYDCTVEIMEEGNYFSCDYCIYYSQFRNINDMIVYNTLVTLDRPQISSYQKCIFIESKINFGKHLQAYRDNSEKLYIVIPNEICEISNGEIVNSLNLSQNILNEYYDILLPYFVHFESLNQYLTNDEGVVFLQKSVCIDLELMAKALFER